MNKFLAGFVGLVVCGPLVIAIVQERNRVTPDVWTGAPTTVRAEMSQEARDLEMRTKMAREYAPAATDSGTE